MKSWQEFKSNDEIEEITEKVIEYVENIKIEELFKQVREVWNYGFKSWVGVDFTDVENIRMYNATVTGGTLENPLNMVDYISFNCYITMEENCENEIEEWNELTEEEQEDYILIDWYEYLEYRKNEWIEHLRVYGL
jgi:hypothetical protein